MALSFLATAMMLPLYPGSVWKCERSLNHSITTPRRPTYDSSVETDAQLGGTGPEKELSIVSRREPEAHFQVYVGRLAWSDGNVFWLEEVDAGRTGRHSRRVESAVKFSDA